MVKKYILLAFVSLIVLSSLAQHCAYDGSSMIMLDIIKSSSAQVQKVYLLDAAGAVVMSKHYAGDKVEQDSARFWKNPSKNNKNVPYHRNRQYFSFAKNYLVLELGGHDQPLPYRVLIVYSSGNKTFRKEVPLLSNHIHQLCTLNKNLWSGMVKPMIVIL